MIDHKERSSFPRSSLYVLRTRRAQECDMNDLVRYFIYTSCNFLVHEKKSWVGCDVTVDG